MCSYSPLRSSVFSGMRRRRERWQGSAWTPSEGRGTGTAFCGTRYVQTTRGEEASTKCAKVCTAHATKGVRSYVCVLARKRAQYTCKVFCEERQLSENVALCITSTAVVFTLPPVPRCCGFQRQNKEIRSRKGRGDDGLRITNHLPRDLKNENTTAGGLVSAVTPFAFVLLSLQFKIKTRTVTLPRQGMFPLTHRLSTVTVASS